MINLLDADPSSLPGIATPFGLFPVGVIISNDVATYNPGVNSAARIVDTNNGSNSNGATLVMPFDRLFEESGSTSLTLGQKQALHAPTPVHLNDSVPVHLYAGGDISGIELFSAKTAEIVAGHDITDIAYYIQNLNADDVARVVAGRDITAFDPNSPLRLQASNNSGITLSAPNAGDIQVAGPGSLEVLAGRNLSLGVDSTINNTNDGTRLGITTIGNFANPFLQSVGADVFVGAGLGNVTALSGSSMNFSAFAAQFLNPATAGGLANRYLPELGKLINLSGASDADIWNAYQAMSSDKQDRLALDIFYLVLRDAGRDNKDPSSPNFNRFTNGYNAIADLFPGNAWKGDITLTSREIKTKSGGGINILAPGGAVNVGINLGQSQPIDQGILTEGGGNINIFARNSVNVGTSRIFTLDGGNEIIWSTTGNIDAGAASKTVRDAVPQRVLIDPNTANVETDLAGFATGGGIGVLQALPGAPIGNVDLIAPVGTVDAGDAGIRSSGNVNIAAVVVLNALNIQAGGNVTGVPVVTAPNIGALTSASSVAGASQATVPTTTGSANNNNQRSIIIVEVIGFGGSDGTTPSQDNAQGREERDQRSYNTNSPCQILGVGALNDRQISALAAEKRTGSQPAR